ncbi:MAG: nondiscriminating aspartyl-tRNA synthetase [Cellvibrionaceae bacterium]|jgi:nondiscriminating aspartyl-tRNA synthetase
MNTVKTTEMGHHEGKRVTLQGWVHAIRQIGGISFVILRDGYGTAQAIFEGEHTALPQPESVVCLTGLVVSNQQAPGGVEIVQPKLELIAAVEETLPVTMGKKELKAALPTLLEQAVVLNRHPSRRAVFKLAAGTMQAFRHTLNQRDFTEIQSPKLVGSSTEGGSNVFEVPYFGRKAWLAQSPQFYKQVMVGVFERVYEVGPVFRAEAHDTSRHINEYVSLDVEFGFIKNHFTVMALVRDLMEEIFTSLKTQYPNELALLNASVPNVPAEIPHIHFREALELITSETGENVIGETDLSPQNERWLGKWAQETHKSDFLFVVGYPMSKRPFYTHPDPANPIWSNSFDLIFRGTELITGGQRRHLYTDYLKALDQANLPSEPFKHYLDAFKFGMPPHGGFAIGLERLIMQLCGLSNVKLATLFPRDMKRLVP